MSRVLYHDTISICYSERQSRMFHCQGSLFEECPKDADRIDLGGTRCREYNLLAATGVGFRTIWIFDYGNIPDGMRSRTIYNNVIYLAKNTPASCQRDHRRVSNGAASLIHRRSPQPKCCAPSGSIGILIDASCDAYRRRKIHIVSEAEVDPNLELTGKGCADQLLS
jgi:hypothetical protein